MRTSFFYLRFFAILFALQAPALATIKWDAQVKMGDLFPSLIVSTATMKSGTENLPNYFGDRHGQIGITVSTSEENAMIRVVVSSTKLIKPSKQDARLRERNTTCAVFPLLEYDYDVLYAAREPFPETVTVDVELFKIGSGNKPVMYAKDTRKIVVQVRSINDCPLYMRHPDRIEDFKWMFGAYVNENHPVVEEILRDALKTGIVDHFDGYQNNEADVVLQVFAIWNVFQQRGIKYSDITTPSAYSEKVFSQHVRFIGDSLNQQQANCVDGSVLFASVFRKIGLNTFLVLVPKHCFVGVCLDEKGTKPFFIETTMLGSAVEKDLAFRANSILSSVNAVKEKYPTSFNTFVAAERAAAKEYHDNLANPSTKNETHLINIANSRKRGIQPLKEIASGNSILQ